MIALFTGGVPIVEACLAYKLGKLFKRRAAKSAAAENNSGNTLVNSLGEPLNSPLNSTGKKFLKIEEIHANKYNPYMLAGRDTELEKKYGEIIGDEIIYEYTIFPRDFVGMEITGRPSWGFLTVKKLPRSRRVVSGIAGLLTLIGGCFLLNPLPLPLIPAAIATGAAALGVRKILTLGRSVEISAETADLLLTGKVCKWEYDLFERIFKETTALSPNHAPA